MYFTYGRVRGLAVLLCGTGTLTLSSKLQSQKFDVGFVKGDSVVIAVPTVFARATKTGFLGANTKLDIDGRLVNGVVEVLDSDSTTWLRNWRTKGFPPVGPYYVSNLKTVSRTDGDSKYIEVTVHIVPTMDYRFFAPVDQPGAIRAFLAPARAADSVLKVAYDSLGAEFFRGPLSSFTPEERLLLLKFAHLTANGTRIGHETFKGVTYLTVTLPGDGNTWNNLVVKRSERVGRLIGAQLALLKAFARVAVPHDSIGGLELVQPSRHGTAPDYTDVATDDVMAYFPVDAMLKFANADITSQQLVNMSIILVNGDRVEVDLSTQ